jgi:hypothetical protein
MTGTRPDQPKPATVEIEKGPAPLALAAQMRPTLSGRSLAASSLHPEQAGQ